MKTLIVSLLVLTLFSATASFGAAKCCPKAKCCVKHAKCCK
jgi:hypothetical protein